MRNKLFLILVIAVLTSLVVMTGTALAYSTGFEEFGTGTLAEALTVSGMTFSSTPAGSFAVASGFFSRLTGHVLLNPVGEGGVPPEGPALQGIPVCYGNVLRIAFASPQTNVMFDFATESPSGRLSVRGLHGGGQVFGQTFTGIVPGGFFSPEGTASVGATVDAIELSTPDGGCFAIDNIQTSLTALPGCDMLLPIPATAVGGTFVADAPLYWAPGKLTSPLVTITAGNSARVLGLDASGQYYQIIWVCDLVWVPTATLGPNYDAVWNGAPLPTGVVE
ncbi:MAG: hypothetical protein KBH93_01645 [Anaerolineae bacterium]|nr:hypothetical protein [Anaerolineae bacterium]